MIITTIDLTVNLCGLDLPSPLILASGTLGEPGSLLKKLASTQPLGAVVTRSVSIGGEKDRFANPSPRFVRLGKYGLLNCECRLICSLEMWCKRELPIAKEAGIPVIASIEGESIEEYEQLASDLVAAGADGIEVNISCTFEARRGKGIALIHLWKELLESVRKAIPNVPVIVKVPLVLDFKEVAEIIESAHADAIAALNTIGPGMVIDLETARPLLGFFTGSGGLSGPALKPISIAAVTELVQASSLPVIGIGGISTGKDVVEYTMAGAQCVEILTAALLKGQNVFTQIHNQLIRWLTDRGHEKLSEIRGATLKYLGKTNWIPHVATVDANLCTGCGRCVRLCPDQAIDLQTGNTAKVDEMRCQGCGLCLYECSEEAISLREFP